MNAPHFHRLDKGHTNKARMDAASDTRARFWLVAFAFGAGFWLGLVVFCFCCGGK